MLFDNGPVFLRVMRILLNAPDDGNVTSYVVTDDFVRQLYEFLMRKSMCTAFILVLVE